MQPAMHRFEICDLENFTNHHQSRIWSGAPLSFTGLSIQSYLNSGRAQVWHSLANFDSDDSMLQVQYLDHAVALD